MNKKHFTCDGGNGVEKLVSIHGQLKVFVVLHFLKIGENAQNFMAFELIALFVEHVAKAKAHRHVPEFGINDDRHLV